MRDYDSGDGDTHQGSSTKKKEEEHGGDQSGEIIRIGVKNKRSIWNSIIKQLEMDDIQRTIGQDGQVSNMSYTITLSLSWCGFSKQVCCMLTLLTPHRSSSCGNQKAWI